jgi:signal transduction histidine kinase
MSRLGRSEVVDVTTGVVVAVALVAITRRIDTAGNSAGLLDPIGYACLAVAGISMMARRQLPSVALVVASAAVGVYTARTYPGGPVYATPLVGAYAVASSRPRATALPLVAGATTAVPLSGLISDPGHTAGLLALVYVGWVTVATLLGEAARGRREYLVGLEERAQYLEETREEEARRRAAEERLRVAQDVHDVVAHALAGIALQAGVGDRLAEQDPSQARDALVGIRQASRDALAELRTTLDLTRGGEADEGAARAPVPGVARLERLGADAAAAGVEVRVEEHGDRHALPSAIDITAYRIVQESLTNVARHAESRLATVTLTYLEGGLEIEVIDAGCGNAGTQGAGGLGIRGMRERAAAVGGRLEAGPRLGGGFRVWAHLPTAIVG